MLSANQVQLLETKFENECGSWFEIEPGPRRGGGGVLWSIFTEYVPLASQPIPWPIIDTITITFASYHFFHSFFSILSFKPFIDDGRHKRQKFTKYLHL